MTIHATRDPDRPGQIVLVRDGRTFGAYPEADALEVCHALHALFSREDYERRRAVLAAVTRPHASVGRTA